MRKLLILSIIVCLAQLLVAQTPRNSSTQTNAKSKTETKLTPKSGLMPSNASASKAETNNNSADQAAKPSKSATTPKTVPQKMPDAPKVEETKPTVEIQWMSFEEAVEKCKTDKRKIFIDVYTDWCGWCKRMDQSTFVDPAVAQYLNDNYYAVKFNAEQQTDISFNNKTYRFKKNGARGYHELAAELLNNRLSFPTVVFLDETHKVIQPIPGYLEASKLEAILNYFGTDSHKTTPWETYERKFTGNSQK